MAANSRRSCCAVRRHHPNRGANLPATSIPASSPSLPFGAPAAPRSVYLAVRPFMRDFRHVEQRANIPERGLSQFVQADAASRRVLIQVLGRMSDNSAFVEFIAV